MSTRRMAGVDQGAPYATGSLTKQELGVDLSGCLEIPGMQEAIDAGDLGAVQRLVKQWSLGEWFVVVLKRDGCAASRGTKTKILFTKRGDTMMVHCTAGVFPLSEIYSIARIPSRCGFNPGSSGEIVL